MEQNQKDRMGEVLRFVVTGGVCFVVEFIALVLLRDQLLVGALGVESRAATLIATPIAFLISVIVNYLLCLAWVFRGAKNQGKSAKAGFLLTSVMGLALNWVLMFVFGALWGENTLLLTLAGFDVTLYMLNKALATLVVMIWNYVTKRAVLTRRKEEKP